VHPDTAPERRIDPAGAVLKSALRLKNAALRQILDFEWRHLG
jgi:hypothetical protein